MKYDPIIQPGPYEEIGYDMRDLYPRSITCGIIPVKTTIDRPIQCPQPVTGRTSVNGGTSITINLRRH